MSPQDSGYYLSRLEALMARFDAGAESMRLMLSARFGEADANTIMRETRAAYEALIPTLPDIGGDDNALTGELIGCAEFLALYRVLRGRGIDLEEASGVLRDTIRLRLKNTPSVKIRQMQHKRFTRPHLDDLRASAARSQERRYPGDWVFSFVRGDGKAFDYGVDYTECAICKYFAAQNAAELVPTICALDFDIYAALGIELSRTTTLAEGGPKCDFRYKRR